MSDRKEVDGKVFVMAADAWRKLRGLALDFWDQVKRRNGRESLRWLGRTLQSLPGKKVEYGVFVKPLDEDIPSVKSKLSLTIRLATETDFELLKDLLLPSRIHKLRHLHAHGRFIFLAFDGERPAGYTWAAPRVEFSIENLKMRLQPSDVYHGFSHTFPDYRRQGIQTALHDYQARYLRGLGYERLVTIIEDDNQASLILHQKVGFTKADRLIFKRVFWKRVYHYQSGQF